MGCDININGKRDCILRDEDLAKKENVQHGIKTRLNKEEMNLCVHLVEKAS